MPQKRPPFLLCVLLSALLASACSVRPPSIPGSQDSSPGTRLDPSTIHNAIPRNEPRSRRGNPDSYVVFGKRYHVMQNEVGYVERGIASWYGTKFHGRSTSSGETYDMYAMTAAHKSLPLPTYVEVTNLQNGQTIVVKVNDRGPFHGNRIIDLSYAAATKLGIIGKGTGLVEVKAITSGQPTSPPPVTKTVALAPPIQPDLFIQVGAFSSQTNASRLRDRLARTMEHSVRIKQSSHLGAPLFRVQIGPLGSIEIMDKLALKLPSLGIAETQVVIE